MKPDRSSREGMALLTVLIMVAIMAAIAVAVLDDVRFSIRRTHNAEVNGQAQWYALGAERLARRQIRRLTNANPRRTPLDPAWNGRAFDFPIDGGHIRLTVRDGQACFNLNSVVEGQAAPYVARAEGIRQFTVLQRLLGIPEAQAQVIANSVTDWIDSDAQSRPLGGEDDAYRLAADGKRPSGVLMAEPSELRQIRGVDDKAYRVLRPHICALPTTDLSPLNINTLRPDDAPVLAMLSDGDVTLEGARRAIGSTPRGGWPSTYAFWQQPAFATAFLPQSVYDQVTLQTRFFDFQTEVTLSDGVAARSGLIVVGRDEKVTTALARWTRPE